MSVCKRPAGHRSRESHPVNQSIRLPSISNAEPAKFGAKFKTVEVRVEERANIVCVATGEQPVSLEWLDKDGNLIQKGDKRFM